MATRHDAPVATAAAAGPWPAAAGAVAAALGWPARRARDGRVARTHARAGLWRSALASAEAAGR